MKISKKKLIIVSIVFIIVVAIILFYFLYLKPCFKKLTPVPINQSGKGEIHCLDFTAEGSNYDFYTDVKLQGTSYYSIENFEYHGDTFLERNPQFYIFDKNYDQRGIEGTLTFCLDDKEYVIELTKKNNIVDYWEDSSYAEMCYGTDTCMEMDIELDKHVEHSEDLSFDSVHYVYDYNDGSIRITMMG